MRTKTKTIFVLVSTLLLGMVLGYLSHGIFMRSRIKYKIGRIRTSEGFLERYEKIIRPTSEDQRDQVRKILKKHHEKMLAHRELFRANIDTMQKELRAVLSEEQIKLLEEHFNRHKDRHKKSRYDKRFRGPDPSDKRDSTASKNNGKN